MADYIAVETGNASQGYLIANGNVYPAASGTSSLLDIPEGSYTYGNAEALSSNQYYSMTDAPNKKEAKKRKGKGFSKFHIGTGPEGTGNIPDKRRPKKPRTGIEFHYDGGGPGTAGCIGYQDNAAKDALTADPNKTVTVKYVKSMDEVKALVEQKLGHKVDWTKVKALRTPPAPAAGSGTHSKNRKGKKVKKANKKVLSGPKRRQTAHRTALLEGGVQIADASTTVFVEGLGVARVNDMTTDGSPVADGESSILVG
jgi:uncharacterized Zn-binding protein involved in type VI secretion